MFLYTRMLLTLGLVASIGLCSSDHNQNGRLQRRESNFSDILSECDTELGALSVTSFHSGSDSDSDSDPGQQRRAIPSAALSHFASAHGVQELQTNRSTPATRAAVMSSVTRVRSSAPSVETVPARPNTSQSDSLLSPNSRYYPLWSPTTSSPGRLTRTPRIDQDQTTGTEGFSACGQAQEVELASLSSCSHSHSGSDFSGISTGE